MNALAALLLLAAASPEEPPPATDERTSLHFQVTVAWQAHPSFGAAYTGKNSLQPDAESATSIVMDLFAGVRLWRGAEFYFEPEMSGGRGLSSTLGVADFPSGEVYRVGNPTPVVFPARAFLRQTFGLGGGSVKIDAGANQLGGTRDRDALTLTLGKIGVADQFDKNPVSNDPHTGFMSWGLFSSAAFDYPADTRGYTWGMTADLSLGDYSVRAGMFLEPQYANLLPMEWDVGKARGLAVEGEKRWELAGRKGSARALGFLNTARMGSYALALQQRSTAPDVAATRADGRTKAGMTASVAQELADGLQSFARVSFDDGQNETWAFTEIDRSFALGATLSGARWQRPDDELGAAAVVSGLSAPHKRYLQAGGYGFLIGDGALNYGAEFLAEFYYRAQITKEVQLGVNYQPIVDPGFNRDRGPVHVFTARAHVAF